MGNKNSLDKQPWESSSLGKAIRGLSFFIFYYKIEDYVLYIIFIKHAGAYLKGYLFSLFYTDI